MKKLSQITAGLLGQPMIKILEEAAVLETQGKKVYHFEVGDSDFDADPHVIEATKKALDDHHTRYVGSMGIDELRDAICDHTEQTLGFRPDREQVLVAPSNSVIDFVIRCVADPGEEIIFSNPGFPSYISVANYLGVKQVLVPLKPENEFQMDPTDLRPLVTDRTRLIIVNSPNNPTGSVINRERMQGIARIAAEKDVYLLSDEMYCRNVYSGVQHFSPSSLDHCRERTIVLNGFSKGYSMSGWRLGYTIGPVPLIEKMGLLLQTIYTCLPPFIQYAGVSALRGNPQLLKKRMSYYETLRDVMIKKLNEIPGIHCTAPQGAIYAFPDIRGTGMTSEQFADFALKEAGVTVVPGNNFGSYGEGFVRFCYLRREELIEEALEGLKKAICSRK